MACDSVPRFYRSKLIEEAKLQGKSSLIPSIGDRLKSAR